MIKLYNNDKNVEHWFWKRLSQFWKLILKLINHVIENWFEADDHDFENLFRNWWPWQPIWPQCQQQRGWGCRRQRTKGESSISKLFPDVSKRYFIRVNMIVHPILPRTKSRTLGQNRCQFWRTTQRLLLISNKIDGKFSGNSHHWKTLPMSTPRKFSFFTSNIDVDVDVDNVNLNVFLYHHTKTPWSQPTIPMTWCDYLAIFRRRPMKEVESSWTDCTSFWGRYSSWWCAVMTMW